MYVNLENGIAIGAAGLAFEDITHGAFCSSSSSSNSIVGVYTANYGGLQQLLTQEIAHQMHPNVAIIEHTIGQ